MNKSELINLFHYIELVVTCGYLGGCVVATLYVMFMAYFNNYQTTVMINVFGEGTIEFWFYLIGTFIMLHVVMRAYVEFAKKNPLRVPSWVAERTK